MGGSKLGRGEDRTQGKKTGDYCPRWNCRGILEPRGVTDGGRENRIIIHYMQCSRCSWRSIK